MQRVDPIIEARLVRILIEWTTELLCDREPFWVQSWCRICGLEVFIEVPPTYEWALDYFHQLDDVVDWHFDHSEAGGWGMHFRFDDILVKLFPDSHVEPIWTKPVWYEFDQSEEKPILITRPTLIR